MNDFLERLRTRAGERRRGRYLGGRIGKSLCFVQGDQNIANQAGAAFRGDLNTELQALVTNSQGASAPGTTYRNQTWHDTTTSVKKRRNAANSAWIVEGTLDESFVLSRSSNTILGVSDFGKTIVVTSTFTQTLTAAATLGDGWWIEYRNDGTGVITLDPNGAETINGATTLALGAGESLVINCNGSAFFTVGGAKTLTNPSNTLQALADGATVNWDANLGAYATLTLGGNRTLAAPTNLKVGGHYVLLLSGAGFTPTWNAVFKGINGGGMPAPAASGMTAYQFESDGTNLYLTAMPLFSVLTNSLAADVTLNNTGTSFDGPVVSQGTVGIFLCLGTVTCTDTGGAAQFVTKLHDGTTTIDMAVGSSPVASFGAAIAVSGVLTNPAGNIRISVQDVSAVTGFIKAALSGTKNSTLTVIRIG